GKDARMRSLFAAALLAVSGTAAAVPVTYDFAGTVNGYYQRLPLPPDLGTADVLYTPMTGSVTFEDSAPDLNPDPEFGVYASILHFSVVINGFEFTYDARSITPGS